MNNAKKAAVHKLALAIDPTTRGFGYALFEGPQTPLDWGTTEVRPEKNENSLERIKKLIKFYQPEVLVIEDCAQGSSHRCDRIKSLLEQVEEFARLQKIPVFNYSPGRIKEVFSFFDIHNKYQIAEKIVEWLPNFASRIPPERKPWMTEDRRMGIFDAVALVLIYYYLEE